jgi:hypothetical protein
MARRKAIISGISARPVSTHPFEKEFSIGSDPVAWFVSAAGASQAQVAIRRS